MKVEKSKQSEQYKSNTLNQKDDAIISEYQYRCEKDPISGALILARRKAGWLDTQRIYYINKDGSARLLTAWEDKNYPKNTFSSIYHEYCDTVNKLNTKNLPQEKLEALFEKLEKD